MPYITETEYSNIQKQLIDREKLLEACKEAKEYFDQTADVDDGVPNEEGRLLVGIIRVINKAEGKV